MFPGLFNKFRKAFLTNLGSFIKNSDMISSSFFRFLLLNLNIYLLQALLCDGRYSVRPTVGFLFSFVMQVPDLSFNCQHPLQRWLSQISTLPATQSVKSQAIPCHPRTVFSQPASFVLICVGCLLFFFSHFKSPCSHILNLPILNQPAIPQAPTLNSLKSRISGPCFPPKRSIFFSFMTLW